MAIISIPSSIGGITIPGLNKGPLSSLFGNPFSTSSFQYPMDLTAANKNHFVQFDIKELKSSELSDFIGQGNKLDSFEGIKDSLEFGVSKLNDSFGSVTDLSKTFTENLAPGVNKTVATVLLYMPDSLEFGSGINYGEVDALQVATDVVKGAGELLGKIGTPLRAAAALAGAVRSSAGELVLKKFGYALNPQVQLVFQGIDFRQYSMSFVFSPNSKEEAQNIQNIIKTFRAWSLPQVVPDTKGMFYKPPAVFDITFISNGRQNKKINKIKQSVITSVDVNYAPNGWAAHTDGTPVQTTMTLQFRETVLIDRNEVLANGY